MTTNPASAEARPRATPHHSLRGRLPLPVWGLYRAVRVALISSAFAGFWLGGTLLAWIVLPIVALLVREPTARVRACQRVLARGFRVFHGYMRMLRLFDAQLVGELPAELAGRPAVLVANHTTLVDVTAILSRVPGVCCVAKPVFASSPFVGRLLRLCGFITAGTSVSARAATVDDAEGRLANGFHVLVFPEGTRSPERSLHRFQRGAFEIACRTGAPIVPLVLRCDPSALRREQRFWDQPDECAVLTIDVGAPILPSEFGGSSRKMRDAVERRYRAWLGLAENATEAGSEQATCANKRPDGAHPLEGTTGEPAQPL